ncbi:MAG: hypothetical protein CV089_15455 [Nitrospira sp. WS110]|nr:hypothetical protein [Nitrospira sp. WS110]
MKIGSLKVFSMMITPSRTRMFATLGVSLLVAVSGMANGNVPLALAADPIPPHVANGLQTGIVTSVESRSLFINGKEYMVDPEVEIRDQEDNVFPPEVVKRDQEVKFHLKKGAGNTIDFLIVYLPQ